MKRTFKTYLEESYKGGVKTSDSSSDKFEQKIAENVKSFCLQNGEPYSSLKVVKYDGEDNKYYSDVKVTNPKNNINVWIETKMNKYSCLGNPSFKYSDREWKCSTTEEDNPLTKYFIDILTEHSQKFIDFCHQKLGDDFELPRDLPDVMDDWKKAGMIDDTDNNVLFITEKIEMEEFGKKISEFYQTAKREPVYYIQIGDELYIIDSNYNPLNLKTHDGNDLKPLSEVHKRGRIQFRAKGIEKLVGGKKKYYYNITCDLKILKDENKDDTEYNCSFSDESKYPIIKNKIYESVDNKRLYAYHCTSTDPEKIKKEGFKIGKDGYTETNLFETLYNKYLPTVPCFISDIDAKVWDVNAKYCIKIDITGLNLYPDFGHLVDLGAYYEEDSNDDMNFWWQETSNLEGFEEFKNFLENNDYQFNSSDFTGNMSFNMIGTACIDWKALTPDRIVDIKTGK